jgi:hypothetical protein
LFKRIPRWAVAGAIAITAVGAGIATGAIPSGDGTIHACYKQAGGAVRLVDESVTCAKGETPIAWSQQGPEGPQGPVGPRGPAGTGVLHANVIRGDTGFCNPNDPTTAVFPCGWMAPKLGAGDATAVDIANHGFVVTFDRSVDNCSAVATMGYIEAPPIDPDYAAIDPTLTLETHPAEPTDNDVTVRFWKDGQIEDPEATVNPAFGTSFEMLVAC